MDSVKISKMNLDDLKEIAANYKTDFSNFWSINILEQELNNEDSSYYVLRSNNEIVGFGGLWKSVDDIHLTNIVIKKCYRNKGLGSILLKELIELVKETGKKEFTLEVNEKNIAAQKLYSKFGFKTLGIRKKYYNNKDNALIMTLYFN